MTSVTSVGRARFRGRRSAFLTELGGKTPLLSIARESGFNRYSVSRWLSGDAEPRLPCFLRLIEVMSRRLPDFLACCTDLRGRRLASARSHARRRLPGAYVRAMQQIIAASEPGECVALYCAQLLDLASTSNALDEA